MGGERGRGEVVGDRHAAEADRAAQLALHDRPREHGGLGRQRRVDRAGEHHHRHVRPARGDERAAVDALQRAAVDGDPHRAVVGVGDRGAEAGEVLGRRGDAPLAQAGGERGAEAAGRRALKPKPRPSLCSAPRARTTSTTGARSTFMPAARSVRAVARPSARATDGRPVAAICGALRTRRAGQALHAAALLVDHQQQRRPQARRPRDAAQRARERPDLRGRAEVAAEEQHAGGLAAADARQQRRRRRAPAEREITCWPGELARGQLRPRRRRRQRPERPSVGP